MGLLCSFICGDLITGLGCGLGDLSFGVLVGCSCYDCCFCMLFGVVAFAFYGGLFCLVMSFIGLYSNSVWLLLVVAWVVSLDSAIWVCFGF